MTDYFCLLLDSVFLKWPTGFEAIVITAREGAVQHQPPIALRLGLPDMGHLMDEMRLFGQRSLRKIITVVVTSRVKMDMSARGHGYPPRLERKPFAPPDRDLRIVDSATEDAAGKCHLAAGQRALTASRAG